MQEIIPKRVTKTRKIGKKRGDDFRNFKPKFVTVEKVCTLENSSALLNFK